MNMNWSMIEALSSEGKVRLLNHILAHPAASMSAAELARITDMSPMSVTRLLRYFESIGLVSIKRIGASHIYIINTASYAYDVLKPLFQHIQRTSPPLEDMKRRIVKALPVKSLQKILLYGSVAKGGAEEGSDIDIVVILNKRGVKQREDVMDALEKFGVVCIDRYGMRLESRVMTEKEFARLPSDLRAAIETGVRIFP